MNGGEHLKEIAFDLYERYILLEQVGEMFRPSESPYNVLDVGGHTPAFWPGCASLAGTLVPGAHVTVVDVVPTAELQNYVRADGVKLPFRDGAFDLVCSLDTLEHLPAERRPALLAELLRVTRDGLYLTFPFDSSSNRWAESVIVEYADVVLHNPVPALLEHRQFGLPDRDAVTRWLSSYPYPCIGFTQGNTDIWLLMMLTYHSLRTPGTDFVLELNRRFNQAYAAQDWAEPAYRAGYLLAKRRNLADLAALRASFASAGKQADLQSVLALCQLFLNIAQNGRVTVDKDRHIRNVEQELALARSDQDTRIRDLECKLAAARTQKDAQLREIEQELAQVRAEKDARIRAFEQELAQVRTAKDAQIRAFEQELAQVRTAKDAQIRAFELALAESHADREKLIATAGEMASQLSEIKAQLQTVRTGIGGLQNSLNFQALLDGRMRDLEIATVTNKRAIQAIYNSRIWKTLSGMGGALLRLTGRAPGQETWAPREGAAAGLAASSDGAADDFLALVCDYPGPGGVLPVRDVVEIRGWVIAESGIERVSVQINDGLPLPASYGIPRPDVARSHPNAAGADQSGYRFFWDTSGLPEGPCTVRVTAVARSGSRREVICAVEIDHKTPPGYGLWITRNEPTSEDLARMRNEAENFAWRPRISILVPVYRTPAELLIRCIESVVSQTYPTWELCLADDGSQDPNLAAILQQYTQRDARIRVVTLPRNRGISGATNQALRFSNGEYVAFLDHDDELAPFALSEIVDAINEHGDTDLFYSDEDKLDEQGCRFDPFFKPEWSPDLFRSCNYICHFTVMKRALVERLGGLDESYSGSQDYEFLLRANEHTQKIRRIPKILYHWRAVAGSTARALHEKPAASVDGRRALAAHLARTEPGASVEEVGACRYRVRYPIAGDPRVSILIPTANPKNAFRAVEDVLQKTTYKHYNILLIDNSRNCRVEEYAARLAARKTPVKYVDWRGKPFNFSQMNNSAARATAAPFILFLNDDTTVIAEEWLAAMLEHAQRPEIGAVGAQLWYPNNLIQHAGVVMGIYGNCSHAFKNVPAELPHYYFDFPNLIRNCSAVTGACMLVARDKFFEVGGFDETNLAIAFQDVDLCLKLLELGYRNVYTPYARLYHYESATKTDKDKIPDPAEDAFMKKKWARYIADDPYYNPNLARRKEDFSLAID